MIKYEFHGAECYFENDTLVGIYEEGQWCPLLPFKGEGDTEYGRQLPKELRHKVFTGFMRWNTHE